MQILRLTLSQVELQRVDGLIAQHAGLKAVLEEEQLQLQVGRVQGGGAQSAQSSCRWGGPREGGTVGVNRAAAAAGGEGPRSGGGSGKGGWSGCTAQWVFGWLGSGCTA